MAADVSSVVNRGNSEMLITRDLLGGLSSKDGSNDLDLGLQLPLDLKSGMIYQQQRCNSPDSPLSSLNKNQQLEDDNNKNQRRNQSESNFKILEESYLELKLLTSSQSQSSVCTLDKVKSALQRAEQESNVSTKKRSSLASKMSLSDQKRDSRENDDDDDDIGRKASSSTGLFAAACPGCLLYVMTLRANPKCPRCNSTVPSPLESVKKPRLDLNTSSL